MWNVEKFLKVNTKKISYFPVVTHWICGGMEKKTKTFLIQTYPKGVQYMSRALKQPLVGAFAVTEEGEKL